jgi:hypothetical protein
MLSHYYKHHQLVTGNLKNNTIKPQSLHMIDQIRNIKWKPFFAYRKDKIVNIGNQHLKMINRYEKEFKRGSNR